MVFILPSIIKESISQVIIVRLRSSRRAKNGRIGGISPVASVEIDANGQLPQGRAQRIL